MSMLSNTLYNLTVEKKLAIGYFGGSITEGAGASDASVTSYRAKTAEWFKNEYPEAEITSIQAAIGGTGSDLGAYRCDRDLLSGKPDLVFYEFSVNDSGADYDSILSNTEAIFRKIFKQNPYADIIVIHTTTGGISSALDNGDEYRSRTAHSAMAHYFGNILQIDVGEVLRSEVAKANGDWKVYTTDTVHPNDKGYQIYTDVICKALKNELKDAAHTARKIPERLCKADKENACMINAYDLELGEGWQREDKSFCGRYPNYIMSDTVGAELKFSFTGERFGLYWMLAKDSGDITYSIDGGEPKTARSWDKYCLSFNRAGGAFLVSNLERGEHSVVIKVSEDKAELSEGNAIRIAAVMIS